MEQENIQNTNYQYLENSFRNWLKTLGYAQSTIYTSGNYARDFFFYLKTNQIETLLQLKQETLEHYLWHLQSRKNKKRPGGLSANYIVNNINALKMLCNYLQKTGKPHFEVGTKTKPGKETPKIILTKPEIAALYQVCTNDSLGQRDMAMLDIYYGCGLRRSEGQALDLQDILLKEKRVFVRKGKNNKERYVPITENIKNGLETYIYHGREWLLSPENPKETALFISQRGQRASGKTLEKSLHKLLKNSKIEKKAGFHALRHTIATHLLQSGLSLEEVSRFLGHSSLESTQIYTHCANDLVTNKPITKNEIQF